MATDQSMEPIPADDEGGGRWFKRGLLVLGVLAIGGLAYTFAMTSGKKEDGPRLTHVIKRNDLLVTVTEQGTLESSSNTEIKCQVRGFSIVTWVVPGGTIVKPGDELVRLDTKIIEETVSLQKTNAHMAKATLERTKADVAKAKIGIDGYLKGRYRSQLQSLQGEVEIAKRHLKRAKAMYNDSEKLFKNGYVTDLEVEGSAFTLRQAKLELQVKETNLDVLRRFTKAMELESLKGRLTAAKSKLQADEAGLEMTIRRRDRALRELSACKIVAKRPGLVIYPSAAKWKNVPDIAEGASVRKDQILLLMPDLTKMQIKVGIHESIVDRIKPGIKAIVTLPDRTLEATVSKVATVTRPSGWWTGNVVKYDTIIKLPTEAGLKPGMSAEVQIVMAEHKNIVTIPVAAVVDIDERKYCWVKHNGKVKRRSLKLGDSNDVFIEVVGGVKEGDEVILNPGVYVEEAKKAKSKKAADDPSNTGVKEEPVDGDK